MKILPYDEELDETLEAEYQRGIRHGEQKARRKSERDAYKMITWNSSRFMRFFLADLELADYMITSQKLFGNTYEMHFYLTPKEKNTKEA